MLESAVCFNIDLGTTMFETQLPEIKERPSKSAQKRVAKATEKFAEKLLKLSPKQLAQLDLPEDALNLLSLAKNTKASSGRNRLIKGVSGILRDHEVWGSKEVISQYEMLGKGKSTLRLTE